MMFGSARADEELDLVTVLKSNAAIPEKASACQRLRVVGTARSIPVLASLLHEERLGHAARYALEGLSDPEAGAALRKALEQAAGLTKVGLIHSVASRRESGAVPLLVPLLASSDPLIATSAAAGLGKIGGTESASALLSAHAQASPDLQMTIGNSLLNCAEAFAKSGDATSAFRVYRALSDSKFPELIRVAAWRGSVLNDHTRRAELVTRALASPDASLRAAACKVVRDLHDPATTRASMKGWESLPVDSQIAVLDASLQLGPAAAPLIRAALGSPHSGLRRAALHGTGVLGDPAFAPVLTRLASIADDESRAAARHSLARLNGPGVSEALLKLLESANESEKAELLRALGERGDRSSVAVLIDAAVNGPQPVRLASLESLRKLAATESIAPLIGLAARTESPSDREPVLSALHTICRASQNDDSVARTVIGILGRLPASERRHFLALLSDLATGSALETAQTATRDSDSELAKEAVRVLAQWPTSAPARYLLELGRTTTDATMQTLALRGCIEVAALEPDLLQRTELLRQVTVKAPNAAITRLVLGKVSQIASAEALQLALGYLMDRELGNEAALAAVTVAEKLADTQPKLAAEAASKILAQSAADEIVKRAKALLAR